MTLLHLTYAGLNEKGKGHIVVTKCGLRGKRTEIHTTAWYSDAVEEDGHTPTKESCPDCWPYMWVPAKDGVGLQQVPRARRRGLRKIRRPS